MMEPRKHNSSLRKIYFRVMAAFGGVIILLLIFLIVLITNPRIEIETIYVPQEVIVEKEIPIEIIKEVEVIVEVEKEPTYVYNITSEEREMLARLVYREGNVESFECQKAIISTVINRWLDGRWGKTLKDVVYAKNQFSPADLLYKTTPTETNYKAVDEVLRYGCTVPKYVMFFRQNYHFDWQGYIPYTKISTTCFGYFEKDK